MTADFKSVIPEPTTSTTESTSQTSSESTTTTCETSVPTDTLIKIPRPPEDCNCPINFTMKHVRGLRDR
jgi:hypothetical protein